MEQTAVEWLEQEIFRRYKFTLQQLNCGPLEEAIQQAKEMEKQQIIDFANDLLEKNISWTASTITGEQYYNSKFKNK